MVDMIVFTDLDGSLLNHDDYSFEDAREAIDRLNREGIPVIMTTSKTRSEVKELRKELGIGDPFIVENGGGIHFPDMRRYATSAGHSADDGEFTINLGKSYACIRNFVKRIAERFGVRGFGDMTEEEIAAFSNLSVESARRAKEREYTEPFLLDQGESIDRLGELAKAEGIKIVQGGRFYHFMSVHQDKGKAVLLTEEVFRRTTGRTYFTIGVGDSPNDYPMLSSVDKPILIPRADETSVPPLTLPNLVRATHPGSRGWSEAVNMVIDKVKTGN
jgi:mannosyl-3-phosphoglycerate phosphatase